MTGQVSCSGWLLLLLLLLGQGRAKPLAQIQSLSTMLEEDLEPPMGAEEMDRGQEEESLMAGALDQPDVVFPWARSLEEQPVDFQQLLRDLLSSARRHQPRNKKGPSRSCFGTKLDRIGAFSGLGC